MPVPKVKVCIVIILQIVTRVFLVQALWQRHRKDNKSFLRHLETLTVLLTPTLDSFRTTESTPRTMPSNLVKTRQFLSFILRHKPQAIGLTLDAQGWANLDELIRLAQIKGKQLNRHLVEEVVARNDKQRFVLDASGARIRARQGYSIAVDVGLIPSTPPAVLHHDTATRFLGSIRRQGLRCGQRLHVHLSADVATAQKVGERHGTPVVLRIASGAMAKQGFVFYLSENSVWLTKRVPARFIELPC